MKICVINGPNLNMLGVREPEIYGKSTYFDLVDYTNESAQALGCTVECVQSNFEGEIVTKIQECYARVDGIIINPAAYTHTSVAILDALKAVSLPTVEVHISKVDAREAFRQHSFVALAAQKTIAGHGFLGYKLAMEWLVENAIH